MKVGTVIDLFDLASLSINKVALNTVESKYRFQQAKWCCIYWHINNKKNRVKVYQR